jgi:N-acetylmuramoyl-L-alanine amidase
MKKNKVIILDNGHGSNTSGKCSPDKTLFEWQWNRMFVNKLKPLLESLGYIVFILVPEDIDVSLTTRANRANKICDKYGIGNCVLLSIHINAAGMGDWMNATGWSAWTTKGRTNSDKLAEYLCDACKNEGIKLRTDMSDGDKDYESNFTIIYKTKCPAVLVENLFMDNKSDLEILKSEEGIQKLLNIHINGINKYFDNKNI